MGMDMGMGMVAGAGEEGPARAHGGVILPDDIDPYVRE